MRYSQLDCALVPVDKKSTDFSLINKYVKNTHAATHSSYSLEIVDLFEVSRGGEDEKFAPFATDPKRMLLWHGSRLTNWVGILSKGLRIAPPEAPVTGYMFGKGVYFADMVSKSANYCFTNKTNNTGILLLCEVALGESLELNAADSSLTKAKLPGGKLSTWGKGGTTPDMAQSAVLSDGTIVPCGVSKKSGVTGHLLYNEFIVYDTSQVRMRYLVRCKFNYK